MSPSRSAEQEFEREAMPHLDALHRAAIRMVGQASDAQDLVQDVFLQAWRSFDRYERGTNCRAWLFAILFNKVQHHRRKQYGRRAIPIGESDEHVLDGLASPPAIPSQISDEEILAALDRLPEPYRDTVILTDAEELSYKEAADVLGVPIGTVMSRLSRGRRMLRAALAECARDYGIRTSNDSDTTS